MVSLTNDDAVIINYGGLGERIQIFTKIPSFLIFQNGKTLLAIGTFR